MENSNRFYTSVTRQKSKIVERYIEDGIRKIREVEYQPKLYILSDDPNSKYRSLSRSPLKPVDFDSIYSMENWLENYKNVPNFKIYGIEKPIPQYIAERYPNKQIKFDFKEIHGCIIDIEVESGQIINGEAINGEFPSPLYADYPVTAITVYDTFQKKFFVYGLEQFNTNGQSYKLGSFDKTKLPPELQNINPDDIIYTGYTDESILLLDFVNLFSERRYDYISGWNSDTFDIPYFCTRIEKILGRKTLNMLSPFGTVRRRTFMGAYGEEVTYTITGISNLDLKDIVAKHGYVQLDNAKLNTAAEHYLKEKKVDYGSYKNLTDFYINDYQNFIGYNIHDVNLVLRIAEKTKFLKLSYTLAFLYHCNPTDTNSTVSPWQHLMYCYGHRNNEFAELRGRAPSQEYPGGFVKEPNPGLYKDVVSVDANALYPHMAQQYNMGVETIISWELTVRVLDAMAKELDNLPEEQKTKHTRQYSQRFKNREGIWDIYFEEPYQFQTLKKLGLCMAPNLAMFKTDFESLLRRVFRDLYATRSAIKRTMKDYEREYEEFKLSHVGELTEEEAILKDEIETKIQNSDSDQHSHKIAANAGYGAVANDHFVDHFDIRIAEAITTAGQVSTQMIMFRLTRWLNETYDITGDHCFYGDTDSVYSSLNLVVKKLGWDKLPDSEYTDNMDNLFKNTLEPLFIEWAEDLASSLNCPINALFFKREAIAKVAIFTAKKRYAMLLLDNEGVRYSTPKLKFVGLEARKADYPMFCRKWLETAYEITLKNDKAGLHSFVKACEKEFINERPINDFGSAKTVNNILQYTDASGNPKSGTPNHVKGAINHNNLLKILNITKYSKLMSGNKYYVLPLKKNSPYGMTVIAYDDMLPPEFNLDEYIDREAAFEKSFLSPLKNFIGAIGWDTHPPTTNSLEDLFS